jgi:ABC-2 type transport system ATP-binding protein
MIKIKGLTKRFRNILALNDLNLEIGKGQIFGYIGPNGAGKTTTIRIIAGLLRPSEGQATVAGVDVVKHPRQARDVVGFLPDTFGVYQGMRVWEYLDFFGAAYRIPRKERIPRVDEVLTLTGTDAMRDYFIESLSHGMRQRVGLAKTLLHRPDVLLLDEPTNGLDPRARIEFRELLKTMRDAGKTLIVSSHILPELATVCDSIGIIERGVLLQYGTVKEVMQKVQQRRVVHIEIDGDAGKAGADLKGYSKEQLQVGEVMGNLIPATCEGSDDVISGAVKFLVERNHKVLWCSEAAIDLEQVYMRVTETAKAGSREMVEDA